MPLKLTDLGKKPAQETDHLSENQVPVFISSVPICLSWMDTITIVTGTIHNPCDQQTVKDPSRGSKGGPTEVANDGYLRQLLTVMKGGLRTYIGKQDGDDVADIPRNEGV